MDKDIRSNGDISTVHEQDGFERGNSVSILDQLAQEEAVEEPVVSKKIQELEQEFESTGTTYKTIPNIREVWINEKLIPSTHKIYTIMNDPLSSKMAILYLWFMQLLVLISILILILDSFESLMQHQSWIDAIFIIDAICSAFFTFDYFGRLILCPGGWRGKLHFIIDIFNIIDFISVIPFYIQLGISSGVVSSVRVLKSLRLLRLLRIVRLGRTSRTVMFLMEALRRASVGITFLLFLFAALVLLTGSLMYFAETAACELDENRIWIYTTGDTVGDPTFFQNIPLGCWWAVVTISTVGFGDAVPRVWYGRIVTIFTILVGLVCMAFPVTLIGNAFGEVASEFHEKLHSLKQRSEKEKSEAKDVLETTASKEQIYDETDETRPDAVSVQENRNAILNDLLKKFDKEAKEFQLLISQIGLFPQISIPTDTADESDSASVASKNPNSKIQFQPTGKVDKQLPETMVQNEASNSTAT